MKTFTLEEANAALPEVRRLAGQAAELAQLIPELQDQERVLAYKVARREVKQEERETLDLSRSALRDAELGLSRALLDLEGIGVLVKDPASGLMDFLSHRDGELVELCWKLGEDRVEHWHRIGEGFAGRKPV